MFEIVHTVTDWYDGPRRGISDFHGKPHLFESEWQDGKDMNSDTFVLSEIDPDIFSLALEDWAIWRRWETAFYQRPATAVTHPALPEDRQRHDELKQLLEERLIGRKSRDWLTRLSSPLWDSQDQRAKGPTMISNHKVTGIVRQTVLLNVKQEK